MTKQTVDYMQEYESFWREIVERPDGTLKRDQVARELADYSRLIQRAQEVYLAVTGERIGKVETMPAPIIEIVNERIDAAVAAANTWWIATNALPLGGEKVLGPFATQELAFSVRSYVEKVNHPATYWVDSEDE